MYLCYSTYYRLLLIVSQRKFPTLPDVCHKLLCMLRTNGFLMCVCWFVCWIGIHSTTYLVNNLSTFWFMGLVCTAISTTIIDTLKHHHKRMVKGIFIRSGYARKIASRRWLWFCHIDSCQSGIILFWCLRNGKATERKSNFSVTVQRKHRITSVT